VIVRASFFHGDGALETLRDYLQAVPEGTQMQLVDNELRFHYPVGVEA
jgi:hypothetical protein